MEIGLEYSAPRATKARFAVRFGGIWYRISVIAIVLFLLVGVGLLVLGQPVGWLICGIAALPIMVVSWYNGELKNLAPTPTPRSLTDILDGEVLGRLPRQVLPAELAFIASHAGEAQFLSTRFGITAQLLQNVTEYANPPVEQVWKTTHEVREQLGRQDITSGMIALALLRQYPEYETLLAKIHLEDRDILEGIKWYAHLKQIVGRYAHKNKTGGIARDWSFGYIATLNRFGQNISEQIVHGGIPHVQLEAHQKALAQIIDQFSGGGNQNIVLVGQPGVGKSTVVQALAELLLDAEAKIPPSLKFQQVFMLDASSLVAAAPGRGELEELIMTVLGEAYAAKNIIIYLDNAQLFFEEGPGSVNIANTIMPVLEAGSLRMILAMDEQRYLQISQRTPAVANTLNRFNVQEASKDETIAVMQDQLIMIEFAHNVTYAYQSLEEAYRLSERYVHDIAMPGRALKLLEAAASYSESGLVTMNSVQQAIEKTMDIKVSIASEVDDREKLLNMEQLIHGRMINQVHAVQVVSDALRRARAGVRNQDRPIGTFLFLGPTGVGKTELAKALADVYFEGEDRIVRLDLNEFIQSQDVSRLIADGANDSSSLTAQIMKQPFSVVLLDEIEKAHPSVLTTLLQLLDEGILRDERNREVSFRDAIIIATSNAGAERIRELIGRGQKPAQFEDQFIDELISTGQFKPEFLNRFDEIVMFTPLGKKELLQVVDLMIAGVNKTLQVQKVEVEVEESAKVLLVEKGYDPRLGARPMRRVVQKAVENTVAKAMLSGEASAGSTITITEGQVASIFGIQDEANQIVENGS
jgi:ATP-dependent Clp protease ATP-binding subunit ClpC